MKSNILLLLIITILVSACGGNGKTQPNSTPPTAYAMKITQYGISWNFDKEYTCGQFVNGDWWIVGPVTISEITHEPGGELINSSVGSMINPRWGYAQGYDSRAMNYNSNLSVSTPVVLNPGDTIVSATKLTDLTEGTYLATAAVLTIVDQEQISDKFRPPFTRPGRVSTSADDQLIFSSNQIDSQWSMLPNLSKPGNTPALASSIELVKKAWIDHVPEWVGEHTRPLNNLSFYGRDIAEDMSIVACQLLLNYSYEEKRQLAIHLIQTGIDYYGMYLDGGQWHADGGHGSGRKFPLVFAGLLLNHSGMKNIDKYYIDPQSGQTGFRFGEDGQTYYYDDPEIPEFINIETLEVAAGPAGGDVYPIRGTRGWIDITNGGSGDIALWRMNGTNSSSTSFTGQEHIDVSNWSDNGENQVKFEAYRMSCTSHAWIGYGLALIRMGPAAMSVWNHNVFFDYIYRWMEQDDTSAINAYSVKYPLRDIDFRQQTSNNAFVDSMWDLYSEGFVPFR